MYLCAVRNARGACATPEPTSDASKKKKVACVKTRSHIIYNDCGLQYTASRYDIILYYK